MRWNWEQPEWPNFRWERSRLIQAEEQFLMGTGVLIGAAAHLDDEGRTRLVAEELAVEAMTTSEIEGEYLNRASVQSSVQRQLGLKADDRRAGAAERGISELMINLYRTVPERLTEDVLFGWHRLVTSGRSDLGDVGRYRTSPEPMQVISGPSYASRVHFEAPPSNRVGAEMERFLAWFDRTAAGGPEPLPAVTRAGLAHLWFECIHPFEDGNGRIGRAVSEKALVQGFGSAALIGLGSTILARQRSYYDALEAANKRLELTEWLTWFAAVVLEAQRQTTAMVEFVIAKTKLLDRLHGKLNARQEKAILRMLAEGPDGFKGGLSAGNYATITGATSATTTRDLSGLVELGALSRSGELRHTRYALNLDVRSATG
ncbi:MAG TPA: Fic family protein [Acidobacteriaceae bacterium]|jgi:Fic family protein|nr:Fic family protein [Acidobacteriaceae bacterium]